MVLNQTNLKLKRW